MNWKPLQKESQLQDLVERSKSVPCLIFKHSLTCSISSVAKHRLEQNWNLTDDEMETYYLDLLNFRSISNAVTRIFDIRHESPQILLIQDGVCTFDASHLDIRAKEIEELIMTRS